MVVYLYVSTLCKLATSPGCNPPLAQCQLGSALAQCETAMDKWRWKIDGVVSHTEDQ